MKLILQMPSTSEIKAVRTAVMLMDAGTAHAVNATLESLPSHAQALREGALPVGSVEFVRCAMTLAGIAEPANLSYPKGCERWLRRAISTQRAGDVHHRCFIKPVHTKLFNGFVFQPAVHPDALDEHDREQMEIFLSLPSDTLVLTSDVITLVSEWRYYVQGGQVIGAARYDPDGSDDAPAPNEVELKQCIADLAITHPYALDMGVTTDGQTVLIEGNDAWAIGLYRGAMSNVAYLEFLSSRWATLLASTK